MRTRSSWMRLGALLLPVVVLSTLAIQPARAATPKPPAVRVTWLTIGDAGNHPDTEVMAADRTTGYGGVDYTYRISKYLVTNAQYAAFLNAVASTSDPYLLYFPCMDKRDCYGAGSGIIRTGQEGSWHYAAHKGREKRPVNYVNLFSSMRFANWMSNGQGHGSTETGAYTLSGGLPLASTNMLMVRRNPGAKVFLPSEDEWYKAAYYDAAKHKYWDYPSGSDTPTTCALPSKKRGDANCGLVTAEHNPANPGLTGVASWFWGDVTDIDAYPGSVSPYGAYDMGGNLFQWTQELSVSVLGQYHAGANVAPLTDALFGIAGNPFETNGIGPCAVVRGTDYGDGAKFGGAAGRTCDIAADPFETYGIRLAALPG